MKRTIIRTLGTCMAAIITFGTRTGMATSSVDTPTTTATFSNGTYKHVLYTKQQGDMISIPCIDYTVYSTQGLNCDDYLVPIGAASGSGSGLGAGTGTVQKEIRCTGSDTNNGDCLWCKCQRPTSGVIFEPCGNGSVCDPTGLKCASGISLGGTYTSLIGPGYIDGGSTSDTYSFAGCEAGWFDTKSCSSGVWLSNIESLTSCCSACSGLKDYMPGYTGNAVTTFDNTNGTNNKYLAGGNKYYSWESVPTAGLTGIESCRGYLPESSYTDNVGTYSIEYCTYNN